MTEIKNRHLSEQGEIWYNITIKQRKRLKNRTEKKRVPASAWHEVASRSTYYSFISKKKEA